KSPSGKVIVRDFHDQLGRERIPFPAPLGAPPAWPTGRAAGETRRLDHLLETLGERRPLASRNVRREAHVMQQAVIVQAQQQRAHHLLLGAVPESADDAIGRARLLDLDHSVAIAALVWQIDSLGDDAVEA